MANNKNVYFILIALTLMASLAFALPYLAETDIKVVSASRPVGHPDTTFSYPMF
jgi:hypothetical protein